MPWFVYGPHWHAIELRPGLLRVGFDSDVLWRTVSPYVGTCPDQSQAADAQDPAEPRRASPTTRKLHLSLVPALVLDPQLEPAGLGQLARTVPFRDLWLRWLDLQLSAQSDFSEQMSIERTDI